MFRHSRMSIIVASLFGAASVGTYVQPAPMVQTVTTAAARKTQRSGAGALSLRTWGYRGPGTTMAQQQRAASKKRNRARNKAHH